MSVGVGHNFLRASFCGSRVAFALAGLDGRKWRLTVIAVNNISSLICMQSTVISFATSSQQLVRRLCGVSRKRSMCLFCLHFSTFEDIVVQRHVYFKKMTFCYVPVTRFAAPCIYGTCKGSLTMYTTFSFR